MAMTEDDGNLARSEKVLCYGIDYNFYGTLESII
jgi:hypothetical protein